jgi:hypothetical protein
VVRLTVGAKVNRGRTSEDVHVSEGRSRGEDDVWREKEMSTGEN